MPPFLETLSAHIQLLASAHSTALSWHVPLYLTAHPSQTCYLLNNTLFKETHLFFKILVKSFSFYFGCAGSLLLHKGFLQLWRAVATLQLWCTGFSSQWLLLLQSMDSRAHRLQQLWLSGSREPLQLWHMGLAVPWHVDEGLNLCALHRQVES